MYSVIDIGSNSVRLLCDGKKTIVTSQLSLGMKDGVLDDKAIERTVNAIEFLIKNTDTPIYAFATEAVRKATNKQIFLDLVKSRCDLSIDVLSGEEEAKMSFVGATYGQNGKINVIDLGGASCEIALGENGKIIRDVSLPFGCVTLTNRFGCNYSELSAFVRSNLVNAPSGGEKVIAVGGTATSLAAVAQKLAKYDAKQTDGYFLSLDDIDNAIEDMKNGKISSVVDIKRSKVILQGAIALRLVIAYLGFSGAYISERDNLEGYAIFKKLC